MASPCAGAPALKYGYVNTTTPSPGEVKGLITFSFFYMNHSLVNFLYIINIYYNDSMYKINNFKLNEIF